MPLVNRIERLLRSRRLRAVGALLSVALFALIVFELVRLWRDGALDLTQASWPVVAAALIVHGLAITGLGAVWPWTVRALGREPPRGLLAVFYVGQLAKYLPGGAWQYVGRAGMAVRLGLPLRTAGASLVVETACVLVALVPLVPLVLATDAVGGLVAAGLSLALLAAGTLARPALARRALRAALARAAGDDGVSVTPAAVREATWRYLVVWIVAGCGFWLMGAGVAGASPDQLALYVGTFAIAWGAGFVVFFAPGGIGVREAVMVGLLGPEIGAADALLVATASRAAFTVVDLVGGSAGLFALRSAPPPED